MELSENMSELAESAFGWDSLEAAQCRKELGDRCLAAEMYVNARTHLKYALEAYDTLFGKDDQRTVGVVKLLKECEAHIQKPSDVLSGEDAVFYEGISKMSFVKSIKAIRKKNIKN
jgi:hypothetical protein